MNKEIECETCIKRKTMYCPNSSECFNTENKPHYQNRIMLLEENKKLKEQYCERTDCSGRLGNSKKVEELQKRIDKAIEYIEEHKIEYKEKDEVVATEFDYLTSPYYLLSILGEKEC